MQTKDTSPVRILLIEDNPGDVMLVRLALHESGLDFELQVIEDGERAAVFALGQNGGRELALPDLVLLDINLPSVDGKDVLAAFRGSPQLRQIPVVILTCSESMRDKLESVSLGANGYLQKPQRLEDFLRLGNDLRDLWYGVLKPGQAPRAAG